MKPNSHNEKGYFESEKIYSFQTSLLDSAGSRWDDWLQFNSGWFKSPRAEEFHESARALLQEEYGTSRLFVLKDPRNCRLVPFWANVLEDLEIAPRYVLTCRNPLEVASSLEARDGLNPNIGLLIWLRHVLDAEFNTRQKMRSFTNFNQLIGNWAELAEKLQVDLQMHLPRLTVGVAPQVEQFLSGGLRHHNQTTEKVLNDPLTSNWIRDTYEILNRWSMTGEDPKDHAHLDEIRDAFNTTGLLFARVVQAGRDSDAVVRETEQRLVTLKQETEAAESKVTALMEELETARHMATTQTEANAELEAQCKELEGRLSQTQSALEQRSHEAEETHATLEKLLAEQVEIARVHEAERSALATQVTTLETQHRDLNELARLQSDKEATFEQDRIALELDRTTAKHAFARENQLRKDAEAQLAKVEKNAKSELTRNTQANALHAQEASDLNRQIKRQSEEMAKITKFLTTSEQAHQAAILQAEAALKAARERAERAERAVIMIQSSTSWRMMAPLRKLKAMLQRGT